MFFFTYFFNSASVINKFEVFVLVPDYVKSSTTVIFVRVYVFVCRKEKKRRVREKVVVFENVPRICENCEVRSFLFQFANFVCFLFRFYFWWMWEDGNWIWCTVV